MLTVTFLSLMVAYVVADVVGAFDEVGSSDEDDDDIAVSNVSPDGADIIIGTNMADVIRAGAGDDQISGEAGDDELFGDEGNDNAFGGPGNDRVFLGDGNDVAIGETEGNDFLRGGAGDDVIRDALGVNTLFGDLGDDRLDTVDLASAPGADQLSGGFGADTLSGDNGDIMSGGAGQDTFEITQTDVTNAPVRITDAEPGETIRLVVPEALASETVQTRVSGQDLHLLFRGELLAIVEGRITAAQLTLELAPNITSS